MNNTSLPPVIAIDGPSASGKGTLAGIVAKTLGWHQLDSGMLYRLSALAVLRKNIQPDNEAEIAEVARNLNVRFEGQQVLLDNDDVSDVLRGEEVGALASRIATYPLLRQALFERQLAFRKAPGLVADGRDMGTVIFPDAKLKIFLIADVNERAQRRYKQLIEKGISANLVALLEDLKARDERDMNRSHAPLVPAEDAIILDSSRLSIEESVAKVLAYWSEVNA
ncbi:(d)CMP kinase [Advenella alkanexedens]|uniref:Cytidylate kinase n=1 Tax=Advenella alkanexedens TaxID=1481665 RepID=A0ABS6NJQ9_9BURK|nr:MULTISPECIES: (d)CMP kinase [Advenella]MBV4395857.1 (d)CMP kinase [Advenella alkanexedens]MDD3757353.1 (d)CMP kinase [Advenella sp.]WKU18715.1 (d)CMP kinase [Advenella alkanexedens]